jgi:tetratricopeptide (TPR) repeat protein
MVRSLDRRTLFGAALTALAALAVYGWTVGFDFIFDDHIQIERNPWLRDPEGFRLFLTRPFWGFYPDRGPGPSNYYRPAFGIFYSLLARTCGLQPAAFHAASVVLHGAVCLLVAFGARRLVGTDAAALVAGLLFAVYPAHAEAVAWVGGQADLLMALFGLIALLAYLVYKDGARPAVLAVAGPVAYLLACLSKEPGAALILVLGAVEASEWRREGSTGAAVRRASARLLPYLAVLALYVTLRVHALGGFAPRHYPVTSSLAGTVAFGGALLARYLAFLVFPFPARVIAWVAPPSLLSPVALAGLLAAVLALLGMAAAAWSGRARREIVVPLAVIVAFLLPTLAANSIGGANFAERYLYLPSAGLAWLAGLLWSRLAGTIRTVRLRRAAIAAALAGLVATAAAAGVRAGIYRDDLSLFQAAVKTTPQAEIAHNNLGMALYARDRLDEAEREYREALRLRPGSVPPLANLGILLERRGDIAGAKRTFEEVLRRAPTHAAAAVHLARFQIQEGDRQGAARRLDALFAAGGESYDALVERADLYLQEDRPGAAIPLLERAVRTFPERKRGRELLERARGEKDVSRRVKVQ